MDEIIDISMSLEPGMITYSGDPNFKKLPLYEDAKTLSKIQISRLEMSSHAGTHVDYPAHFFKNGKTSSDFGLESFVGEVYVVDLTGCGGAIEGKHLKDRMPDRSISKLLLRTSNSIEQLMSKSEFTTEYAYLELSGAEYLVERGVKTVGIDYLSIEKYRSSSNPVHKFLLKNDVIIIEALNLYDVEQGFYYLACLPLRIEQSDGAPVRAALIKKQR